MKTRTVSNPLSDTPRLQYYDVQTLEYRYISKLPMKNERIWSYVKETTTRYSFMHICRLCTTTV
jgi:hypothetical protein